MEIAEVDVKVGELLEELLVLLIGPILGEDVSVHHAGRVCDPHRDGGISGDDVTALVLVCLGFGELIYALRVLRCIIDGSAVPIVGLDVDDVVEIIVVEPGIGLLSRSSV